MKAPAVNAGMRRDDHSQPSAGSGKSGAWFTRLARFTAHHAGRPSTFLLAAVVIVGWAVTGPIFHYSDTWQLVINTGTTIITFLMVFLIQNTQNRDSQALHLKLDELIRAQKGARNMLLGLDDLSDEELDKIRLSFAKIAAKAKESAPNETTADTQVIAITRKK
jgi:low affinity Fe/Cu permease